MQEMTINLGTVKYSIASSATKLTIEECNQVIKYIKNYSVKVYQGGNPDYRIVEILCQETKNEDDIARILREDFVGGTVSFELKFKQEENNPPKPKVLSFNECIDLVLDIIKAKDLNGRDYLLQDVYDLWKAGNQPKDIVRFINKWREK